MSDCPVTSQTLVRVIIILTGRAGVDLRVSLSQARTLSSATKVSSGLEG